MTATNHSLAERIDEALGTHYFSPQLCDILTREYDAAIDHIVEADKPEELAIAFLGSPSPIVAKAMVEVLKRMPESPSIALLNKAVYAAFHAYFPESPYAFERRFGGQLHHDVRSFLEQNIDKQTLGFFTATLYGNLFRLAPDSRTWIAENFLSFSPLDPNACAQGLSSIEAMSSTLNAVGLNNLVIRERSREVLDVQIANAVVNPQFVYLLVGQPEFDTLYLAKLARYLREEDPYSPLALQDNEETLRKLARVFVSNAPLQKVDEIRATLTALCGDEFTVRPDRDGANLLMDFATASPMASKAVLALLYRRKILTPAEIGPHLLTLKDLSFASRLSRLPVHELLTHAPESLQALHLEHEIGL
ncbi:hypothetical protein DV532_28755 (plasmid) [Pseudomonas sp. Leaf58]|uniref:hypothetical protein n=1 Tax=Pseudomonas sp. Leaf58 TaxID=1736226 RepID=UPI0006F4929C|nr:hypothetical protein [Pseudomonas sp. Leaf58]AYG48258.1 hypothetical protein DV532_28755 [Pseudomonas sp. Leaf58]KQN62193.1 hypothetical protein ASF02_08500 [Pseudomonas sp. Leaf58]